MNISDGQRDLFKTSTTTAIFCLLVAVVTNTIWPSSYLEHLVISFGYGIAGVSCPYLIQRLMPKASHRTVVVGAVVGAMLFGTANAYYWLNKFERVERLEQMSSVVFLSFLFTAICFFYFYAQEHKLIAQKEIEKAKRIQSEQEKALAISRLRQLQSQIEPHFMFNTLANISALIDQDPASAKSMLEKLTDLMRGTMNANSEDASSLSTELKLAESYLAIQQIRLGNRLTVEIKNEVSANYHLPPLLLQPIVENAIQHGIEPSELGGKITIRVLENSDELQISVEDTGIGFSENSATHGHGVGLSNTTKRLKGLFGSKAKLVLTANTPSGTLATIAIPTPMLNVI